MHRPGPRGDDSLFEPKPPIPHEYRRGALKNRLPQKDVNPQIGITLGGIMHGYGRTYPPEPLHHPGKVLGANFCGSKAETLRMTHLCGGPGGS
jgi:hypothetical protein